MPVCMLFQVPLKNYVHLKSTKPVATKWSGQNMQEDYLTTKQWSKEKQDDYPALAIYFCKCRVVFLSFFSAIVLK